MTTRQTRAAGLLVEGSHYLNRKVPLGHRNLPKRGKAAEGLKVIPGMASVAASTLAFFRYATLREIRDE